jgi:hypothetical protein
MRAAAARIRANREVLHRFREGEELGGDRQRLELLDFVDRLGDVPRRPCTRGQRAGQDVVRRWVFHYGVSLSRAGPGR